MDYLAPTMVTVGNTAATLDVAVSRSSAMPQAMSCHPSTQSQLNYPVNVPSSTSAA